MLPDSIQLLELVDAVQHVLNGGRIRREEWDDAYWVEMHGGLLSLRKPDGSYHGWIMSYADWQAQDWVTLNG